MNGTRRKFLKIAGLAAAATATAGGLMRAGAAWAQGWNRPAFESKAVADVLKSLGATGAEGTDEAALAEQAGCTVLLVPGDPCNIKITTAADLAFARGLLLERGELS